MIRATIELLTESGGTVRTVKVADLLIDSHGTRRDSNYDVSVREAFHILQEDLKAGADLIEEVTPRTFTVEHFDRGRGFLNLTRKCIDEHLKLQRESARREEADSADPRLRRMHDIIRAVEGSEFPDYDRARSDMTDLLVDICENGF